MKNSLLPLITFSAFALLSGSSASASSATWTGGTGAQEWNSIGNWSGGTVPGNTGTTTDTSLATFNTATPGTAVDIDAGRNLKTITFDTAAGSFTIGAAGVNLGNALALTNGGTISFASTFTGSGITETFNAPLILEPANSTSGGSYSFTNNTLSGSNDAFDFAGNISGGITSSAITLNLTGTSASVINTISGALSNGSASSLSLALSGNSTWLLNGNNSGMTGGTISVGAGTTLTNGSTLLIGSNNALGSDTVNFIAGNGSLSNFGAVGNITVANSFTGNSTSGEAFVGSGNLTINGTFTNSKVTNPSLYNLATGTLTFGGTFNLISSTANAALFQMQGSGNTVFAGNINDSASTGTGTKFLNFGSGTITISGNYNATGAFFDYGGTLVLDTSSTGTRLPNAALSLAGVTLDLSGGSSTSNQTVNGTTFHLGQTTIQDTNSGTAQINLGAISTPSGGGGALVNFGSGAATTSTANGSSGILGAAYTFNGTDWAVSNGATTAISGYNAYTAFSAVNGAGINYLLTGSGTLGTSVQQGTLKINSSGAGQSLALSSGVTYTVTGLLYTGSDDYSMTGGTLNTTQSQLALQQWGSGKLTISSAIADRFGAVMTLVKGGTGTLILSGANAYTGVTDIDDGTVSITSDSNLGGQNTVAVASSSTGSTAVTLAAATADLVVGSSFLGSTVTSVSGTSVTLAGNANQNISSSTSVGFITSTGNLTVVLNGGTLSANSTFSLAETLGAQTVNRSILLAANGGTLDVTNGNTLTVAGVIGNATNNDLNTGTLTPLGALTKTGLGTLVLSGANTYTGGTTINAGTLEFVTPTSTPASGGITVNSGATLAIAVGGAGQFGTGTSGAGTIGGIFSGVGGQGTSTVNLQTGSAVGIDTTGGSATYAGNITNAGVGVTKLGTNSLTFTGNNTYTGGTIVSMGSLIVNNTSGSGTGTGSLLVNSGATVGGTGTINSTTNTINGNVQVGAGGVDTVSSLTMTSSGNTTFSGANLTFNLSASVAGQGNRLAVGSSSILFSGANTTLTLNLVGSNTTDIANDTAYVLFNGTNSEQYSGLTVDGNGHITNLNLSLVGTATNGELDSIFYGNSYLFLDNGNIDIEVVSVPEPGTWALMLGGLALLLVGQRARRSKVS